VDEVEAMKKERQFELEVDWIKALPGQSRAGGQGAASVPRFDVTAVMQMSMWVLWLRNHSSRNRRLNLEI
jgi:hypothetical protein